VALPKSRDIQTRVPKRQRSESSTPVKEAKLVKRPRYLTGQGMYREALTNVRTAILKDNYQEGKLSEEEQNHILAEIVGALKTMHR
jgi:hypothetical protein